MYVYMCVCSHLVEVGYVGLDDRLVPGISLPDAVLR